MFLQKLRLLKLDESFNDKIQVFNCELFTEKI